MAKWDELQSRILAGNADANISFADLRGLLLRLGFEERTRGSHHVFGLGSVLINLQPDGRQAKSYQVRQVRSALVANNLIAEKEDKA